MDMSIHFFNNCCIKCNLVIRVRVCVVNPVSFYLLSSFVLWLHLNFAIYLPFLSQGNNTTRITS